MYYRVPILTLWKTLYHFYFLIVITILNEFQAGCVQKPRGAGVTDRGSRVKGKANNPRCERGDTQPLGRATTRRQRSDPLG